MAAPPWSRSASFVRGKTPSVGQVTNPEFYQLGLHLPDTKQAHVTMGRPRPEMPRLWQPTLFPRANMGTRMGAAYGLKSTLSSLLHFRDFEQHPQILQCKFPAVVVGGGIKSKLGARSLGF